MQTANIQVALGGDKGNTVPKYGVTAAEIAVLRKIHGEDSISEVEPAEDKPVKNSEELKRLKYLYGHARDEDGKSHVEILYPGAAARVHETLGELELDESVFKAETRVKPGASKAAPKAAKKGGKKGAEQAPDADDADDLPEVEADDNVLE